MKATFIALLAVLLSLSLMGADKDFPGSMPAPKNMMKYNESPASVEMGRLGQTFIFKLKGRNDGEIWGTDIYSGDSDLATAAVHAGFLKAGEAGDVKVRIVQAKHIVGRRFFLGTTRNGIKSLHYERFPHAYRFENNVDLPELAKLPQGRLVAWSPLEDILSKAPAGDSYKEFHTKNMTGAVPWKIPPEIANRDVVQVVAGAQHNVALLSDGTLRCWGKIGARHMIPPLGGGQIGLTNCVAIATSDTHTLALRSDGSVIETFSAGRKPITDAIAISAGNYFSLAIKKDGSVVAWGRSNRDYVNINCKVPKGLRAIAVDAGVIHSLAIRRDGTVVAWGKNENGQCDVPSGLKDVVAIRAGRWASYALKKNGELVVFGKGAHEVIIRNVKTFHTRLSTGCALLNTGEIKFFPRASLPQESGIPIVSPRDLKNIFQVSLGGWHGIALVGGMPSTPKDQPRSTSNLKPKATPNSFEAAAALEKIIRRAVGKPEGEVTEADLEKVTSLTLQANSDYQITDVGPLANFTKLEYLYLTGAHLTDVSPLAKLTQLKSLILFSDKITDVSSLARLVQLEALYLDGNQLTDVSALAKLVRLKKLGLNGNKLTDVSPLAKLTQLEELSLLGNKLTDVSALAKLTQMERLGLEANQLTDVTHLTNLTKLQKLSLYNNQLTDISALAGLTRLEKLGLYGNKLANLKGLADMAHLKELSLGGNKLTDVSALGKLEQLEELSLNANQITDLSPLAKLKKLEVLTLANNAFTDSQLQQLTELTKLRMLKIGSNNISDVSPLAKLTQLKSLYLSDNPALTKAQIAELQKALPKTRISSNPTK